tara:strand:+ start:16195 stop:16419 length:225 start_codon:yes stop_codon:yes gene_type:complete
MNNESKLPKKYTFNVGFPVSIVAKTYNEAVTKAEKLYPNKKNMTTFKVLTDDVEFYPSSETLKLMHDQEECSCE